MCTSFVYRKENILIGMNFDNDGKEFLLSTCHGNDFLVSVKTRGSFFPSFGISGAGVFVNDLMVDSNGEGEYKRQNDRRWVTTTVVRQIMENQRSIADMWDLLQTIEVVNSPFSSTHNLIVDQDGSALMIEPGRRAILSGSKDSPFYTMTNFPLSEYADLQPLDVKGIGSDRYRGVNGAFLKTTGKLSANDGLKILQAVCQIGPEWKTEISLIYDPSARKCMLCLSQDYQRVFEYDLSSEAFTLQGGGVEYLSLTKKGMIIHDLQKLS